MKGFHVNWTAPFFAHGDRKKNEYRIEDFELLTTILSVLKWKELNGQIKLYTDDIGAEYYKKLGIIDLWDLGVDTAALKDAEKNINAEVFWAAGKLIALQNETAPCIMLDTDLVLWKSLDALADNEVTVLHREDISEGYVPETLLSRPSGYIFDPEWSWKELPCNTAFAYFKSDSFKNYYTGESFKFMCGNMTEQRDISDRIIHMIFAEQRIISMCAAKSKIRIDTLLPNDQDYWRSTNLLTHTWGYKYQLKYDNKGRKEFCTGCLKRIKAEFPEMLDRIMKIDMFKEYKSII